MLVLRTKFTFPMLPFAYLLILQYRSKYILIFFSFSQQKFKKLIESTGKYGLVNGKVVDLEEDQDKDSDEPAAATPATPAGKRGRGGKTAATPRSTGGRKRKAPAKKAEVADADEDDVGDEEEATEAPVKKRANTGKKSATQTKVKKETAAATEANGDGGEDDGDGAEENGNGQSSDTDGAAPDVV